MNETEGQGTLGIVELLTKVGDDRIAFQNLDQCSLSTTYTKKSGTKITFGTEEPISLMEGTRRLGLVIWLDRDVVAEILDGARATGGAQ